MFQIYGWAGSRIFDFLLKEMAQALVGKVELATPEVERNRIEAMAADLNEMRPLLVRNFRPAKARIELPGELVADFAWAQNNRTGVLRCARSERELLEQDHRAEVRWPLGIDYLGILSCHVNPWRNVATWSGDLPSPALTVGRVVLEAIHQKIFSFYERLDVAGLLERWRAAPESTVAPEEEAQVIAASIVAGMVPDEPARAARRVTSSLRLSRLTATLEKHFGCSSRSGKGSELLFYREGGVQAFVARHKQNPTVSAVEIQRILKKLGISVREWMRVACP